MRLGLFLALLVPLIVVVGLIAPLPGGLGHVPLGTPDVPTRPQCLVVETDEPLFDEFLPRPLPVQLLPDPAPGFVEGPAYQAAIGPDSMRAIFAFSVWQWAGQDSIDITWYHSPPLRIPARGERRVGRLTRRGYVSLFHALLAPDRVVHVQEVPCPVSIDIRAIHPAT